MSGKPTKSRSRKNKMSDQKIQTHLNSHSNSKDKLGYLVDEPIEIRVRRPPRYIPPRRIQLTLNHRPSNGHGYLLAPNGEPLSQRQKMVLAKQRISNASKCDIVHHNDRFVLELEYDDWHNVMLLII